MTAVARNSGAERRIVIVTFGSRGDVQPFCILGRRLQDAGHRVALVSTGDNIGLVRRFGLDLVQVGMPFEALFAEAEFDHAFRGNFGLSLRSVRLVRAMGRKAEVSVREVLRGCLTEVASADLVVYNPIAFFAGAIARELGIPAVAVASQPLMPSWRQSLSVFGGRDFGPVGNRLTYETFRLWSVLLSGAFRALRRESASARRLRSLANPLSLGIRRSTQIMAFSPALSPDPGDWAADAVFTGFWCDEPKPGAVLSDEIMAFLSRGAPPVYIGFGSMMWGRQRNTDVVMRALALWGGRAILRTGGALRPEGELPPNVMTLSEVNHMLLFPHVAAAVHHGGSGTTGAVLRCGLPGVVLPVLGDQLYWGRRVAAAGAGEEPIPLRSISPEQLAGRIANACGDPGYRAAAQRMADAFAREPGVAAAVSLIERLLGASSPEPAA